MLPTSILAFVTLLTGAFDQGPVVRRVTVQDTVVFRIPVRPAPPMPIEWRESKGPRCVPTASIIGASLHAADEIDFFLAGRRRIRAEIDSHCPAIDFYKGFYIEPRDEKLCARRDELRNRMGGSCQIRRFRTLTPQLKSANP